MSFITRSGSQAILDGKPYRWTMFNQYTFIIDSASQASTSSLLSYAKLDGFGFARTWMFDRANPTNSPGNFRYLTGSTLNWREAQFVQSDMILDEFGKAGIKAWLSFADNPSYSTKLTYITWANAVYGTSLSTAYPYTAFWTDTGCKTLYKQFLYKVLTRVNTINGKTYKDDPVFNVLELINEGRYDVFDTEGGTQNTSSSTNIATVKAWIEEMSAYVKSISTNQLIAFGGCEHTWEWVNGDSVSNGSGYGGDYKIFATISTLDILDFHLYPTQADANLLQKYGQRLGFPNSATGRGLTTQIQDWIKVGHANNKIVVISEVSLVKEYTPTDQDYPLYPRVEFCKRLFRDFYDAGGDAIGWWSYSMGNAGYELYALGSDGPNTNLNFDDNPMLSLFRKTSYQINGKRIPVSSW